MRRKDKQTRQTAMLKVIRRYLGKDNAQITETELRDVEKRLGLPVFRIRLDTRKPFWARVEIICKAIERKAPAVILRVWASVAKDPVHYH